MTNKMHWMTNIKYFQQVSYSPDMLFRQVYLLLLQIFQALKKCFRFTCKLNSCLLFVLHMIGFF